MFKIDDGGLAVQIMEHSLFSVVLVAVGGAVVDPGDLLGL